MHSRVEPVFPRGGQGAAAAACFVLALVLLVVGWRAFWFLTDDAYIAFRYVSNGVLGHGYVWNAPPFLPVEGYTSFLWVLLLDVAWRLLGLEPPATANVLSLGFSAVSLVLTGLMVLRMDLGDRLGRVRVVVLGLVLVATATNRTFLTWSSSGLETAMFNALILGWIYVALFLDVRRAVRLPLLSCLATLVYLTRPDGILFVAATLVLAAIDRPAGRRGWRVLTGLAPLLPVPLHILWRRSFYGEWLPNSYYAKHVAAWPESGLRYALSFVLEYALWVWLLYAVVLVLLVLRRGSGTRAKEAQRDGAVCFRRRARTGVVVAVLGVHVGYYTLIIGGDHFEYRVYSQLVPLIFLSLVWLVARMDLAPGAAATALVTAVLLTYPVPYTHWLASRSLTTRKETFKMRVPVEAHWPPLFAPYARWFDRTQFWLIEHFVCVRHQEHKINLAYIETLFPTREEGSRIPPEGYPVMIFPAVGYASWALPNVNILDTHGINDRHVARTPIPPDQERSMAHDRQPPPGYLDCFRANVRPGSNRRVAVLARRPPLTAEDIEACEELWSRRVRALVEVPGS